MKKRKDGKKLLERNDRHSHAPKVVVETLRMLSTDEQRGIVGGESAATIKPPVR